MHLLVDSVSKTISLALVSLDNAKRFRYKNTMVLHDLSKVGIFFFDFWGVTAVFSFRDKI